VEKVVEIIAVPSADAREITASTGLHHTGASCDSRLFFGAR
jgi:hypothetical protein